MKKVMVFFSFFAILALILRAGPTFSVAQQKDAIVEFPDGWESPLEMKIHLLADPQQKLSPAQQIQQLKQQNAELGLLLKAEKADTEKLILGKASIQGAYDQAYNKLLQTQKTLKELVKNGKIKLKDLAALSALGYDFGNNAELPSSLPDSTDSR